MILHNGSVRTGDPRLPLARAIAIAGDRIGGGVDVREGDRSLVSNERVDLGGRCVVPGFTDAHVHFLEWSLALGRLDLGATRSHAEVLAAAAAAAPRADGWVIGAGWRAERWPAGDPPPHREALDAACGDRPVLLWAHDHHTAWLSSAALDAASDRHGARGRARCRGPAHRRAARDRGLGRGGGDPRSGRARARRARSRTACARRTRAD